MAETLPSRAGDVGSIPGQGIRIPHAGERCGAVGGWWGRVVSPCAATKTQGSEINKKKFFKVLLTLLISSDEYSVETLEFCAINMKDYLGLSQYHCRW